MFLLKSYLKKFKILVMLKYLLFGFISLFITIGKYIYCIIFFNDGRMALYCDLTVGLTELKTKRTILPHPIGVVIGKGVQLGYDCKIYQCVTIGSKLEDGVSYPKLGDNVTIYANSVIVGGVSVGNNVTIGASTLILKDIPDNCIAIGNPAKIIPKI
ncbi:TPA: serine acetyltransferase [Klebsiella pneumoniae]|uniref:serine O-acetyltransferase n=1 Tax=Klebsiella pneumoniae TaxID=573 RepID=UPI0009F85E04|nr:serine acetyltransferase [Klebsiella pneumoniae]MBD7067440.1 serine acetyltransferase [Klebsiella pneumoniae]MBX4620922.1 serine acetyltransferase [Klebsiella pneumoniae]ORD42157.1 hypothetical protein A4T45_16145 [Klebsiella pneumoniae]ORD56219.1 hypothetical protein A4T49_13665 [Klebsiella pneumoniae]ORD77964.1 hypothetical protein A4T51_12630 [Klebsiella pneumoniae]